MRMNFSEKIKIAKHEAERFLTRVTEWEAQQGKTYSHGDDQFVLSTPRENGAVKRASMDLTRSLADLRNNKK